MDTSLHVVITGVGIVSPLGASLAQFWERLENGESGVVPLTRFDPKRFSCRLAAEVGATTYRLRPGPYSHEIRRAGKFAHYAVAAAEDALSDSGIRMELEDSDPSGLFIGVSTGGLDQMEYAVLRQEKKGTRKISPYQITSMLPNMATSLIALKHGFTGVQYTISGACASGSQAIGNAFHAIRSGHLAWALTGGSDGVLTPISFSSFQAMRMLSTNSDYRSTPRPFDQNADGIIIGEGAALFVLEESTRAKSRGAKIYGEVLGYGTCSGTQRIALQSTPDLVRCMNLTLSDAALSPREIDCVYAQAAGIRQGDESELKAFRSLFPGNGRLPAITSIKGHIGHTFAASGPLSMAAAIGVLNGGRVSSTLHLESVDPQYSDLNLWRDNAAGEVRHCLINTFGFGGVNAGLVVSQHGLNGNKT